MEIFFNLNRGIYLYSVVIYDNFLYMICLLRKLVIDIVY